MASEITTARQGYTYTEPRFGGEGSSTVYVDHPGVVGDIHSHPTSEGGFSDVDFDAIVPEILDGYLHMRFVVDDDRLYWFSPLVHDWYSTPEPFVHGVFLISMLDAVVDPPQPIGFLR